MSFNGTRWRVVQDMVKEFGRGLKFIEGSGCQFGFYSKSNGNLKNFK